MSVSKTIEPFLQKYPSWVYFSGAGSRMLAKNNWNSGIKKNIPQHYKDFYRTWKKGPQEHIHSKVSSAKFRKDEWGEIHPIQNPRIHVVYPAEFHDGMWGGEGVIKGLLAQPPQRHRSFLHPMPKYWWPKLLEGAVYSEILNKHIEMVMTERAIKLVDEAEGFDNYILKTPVNEIYAWKLLKLKREMLLQLCSKDNFAGRAAAGQIDVYEKYNEFIVNDEQADWTGLTLQEAIKKQIIIENIKRESGKVQMKMKYRKELIQHLQDGGAEELEYELQSDGEKKGLFDGVKKMFK